MGARGDAVVGRNYEQLVREAEQARPPAGAETIRVQVGSATCEHAAGAETVRARLEALIAAADRPDIVLQVTGCTGRCSREPIVAVMRPGRLPVKYQQVDATLAERIFREHVLGGRVVEEAVLDGLGAGHDWQITLCGDPRCGDRMNEAYRDALRERLAGLGLDPATVDIRPANCFGLCDREHVGRLRHVLINPGGVVYRVASEEEMGEILDEHVRHGRIVERLRQAEDPVGRRFMELYGDVAFFSRQSRVALRNAGIVDPCSLDAYIRHDGFRGLAMVLEEGDPAAVIAAMRQSRLRGRGGAGYGTGLKWANAAAELETTRYIICNADEGDPGAFMDRDMLESDPFSVIEGMLIGAYAMGAEHGFFYIRSEYPLAVERVSQALDACRKRGLLGGGVLGSSFAFEAEVRLGAGAFVCGEETALIASIEGRRGWPRIRPPYPSHSGLWGKPTVINNVETLANVPAVIRWGPEWFARLGTEASGGTKVFALAGKVRHTGLVEVPMGTPLRDIVFGIGGGIPGGKALKAVQTGGPAGGCIPASLADIAVDYEPLGKAGSIMGSGGMIVMDEDDCMVDIARFYMQFSQDESCGQCTPCREGTKRLLEILERIAAGDGEPADLDRLERLGKLIQKSSLCGLGRAAPNPVLSTLRYFREEYEAHVRDKRCPAGRCSRLRAGGAAA